MHRIDTANREQDKFGAGKDGFTEGTEGAAPPTELTADWFDGVQEEIIAPIEGMGITLVKNTRNQLYSALQLMRGRTALLAPWAGLYNSTAGDLDAIHYDSTLDEWVAVGQALGATPYILHSSNGTDWYRGGAAVKTGAKNFSLFGVGCSGSLWVAVGDFDAVDAYVLTSPDASTWTERAGIAGNAYCVIYGASHSLWVVGCNGGRIYWSSDGTTWSSYADYGSQIFRSLAYSGTSFVACGDSGVIYSSTSGTSWTSRTSGTSSTLQSATYSPELDLFCIVGFVDASRPLILTSDDDGVTWTRRTTGVRASSNPLRAVKWIDAAQMFVAAGSQSSTHEMYVSFDGITWIEHNLLSNQSGNRADNINAIAHNPNNGMTVCCGDVWGATMATLFRTPAMSLG